MTPLQRFALLALFALPLAAQPTEQQLDAARRPLDARLQEIRALRRSDPKAYIEAMLQWVDEMDGVGRKFAAVSQAGGARSVALRELSGLAAFVRVRQHDPKGAIELYRKAEKLGLQQNPGTRCCAMGPEIADIYQFDLGDAAKAALTLENVRRESDRFPIDSGNESGPWLRWQGKWLDAEIAFLRKGQRFSGALTADDLGGFMMQLYYGGGVQLDDLEERPEWMTDYRLTPDEREKRGIDMLRSPEFHRELLTEPGSHANFLRRYFAAVWLEKAEAWLKRNDPAGFWAASFIAIIGVADAKFGNKPRPDRTDDLLLELARAHTNEPTPFALFAREYAKTHPLPKVPDRRWVPGAG